MKRTLILILTLLMTVSIFAAPPRRGAGPGSPQNAQGGPGGPGGGRGEVLSPGALADFLDLDESQIASIETLRETLRSAIEPLREQQRANREAIKTALEAGNAQAAGQAMLANHNLREQMKAARDSFETSFEALLTASQKAKWDVYQEIVELRHSRPDGPPENGPQS